MSFNFQNRIQRSCNTLATAPSLPSCISLHTPPSIPQRRHVIVRGALTDTTAISPIIEGTRIEKASYENGTFSITGVLTTATDPDTVFEVLTDYDALPRVFHNVEECAVRWTEDGDKQLIQSCSWRFLVFRGTFVTELAVLERDAVRQLEFSLLKSGGFMRKFVGSWQVRPSPLGGGGGSEIFHSLSVQPSLAPPESIGQLTKKIFASQVEGILGDLAVELQRRSIDVE